MNKEKLILSDLIHVIVNESGEICYCSHNIQEVNTIVEKIDITNFLGKHKKASSLLDGFLILIEEIQLMEKLFYLLTFEKLQNRDNNIQELRILAYLDAFTGLFGRNLWEHLKNGQILMIKDKDYAMILIDVDCLKIINDSKGHTIGDQIIKIVAYAIQKSIRKEDIAIRYGGDEFLIILPDTDTKTAQNVLDRIKVNIQKDNDLQDICIDISAGISVASPNEDMNMIMQRADFFMYQEKLAKKRICVN